MLRSFAILLMALGIACGPKSEKATTTAGDTLTERQRDSLLSTSRIPGARGVGAAMRNADSTSAGIRAADTISP